MGYLAPFRLLCVWVIISATNAEQYGYLRHRSVADLIGGDAGEVWSDPHTIAEYLMTGKMVRGKFHAFPDKQAKCSIAVLVALSTRGIPVVKFDELEIIKTLNPSMLETVHPEDPCEYAYYLCFDTLDVIYSSGRNLSVTEDTLAAQWKARGRKMPPLTWIQTPPYEDGGNGPAKAWNAGFKQAYEDGLQYFYWIGEDTTLVTHGWGQKLTDALKKQNDVGTVGPHEIKYMKKGNRIPFTMVGRPHMQISHHLFPEQLHNWYIDDWIKEVYSQTSSGEPRHLAKQLQSVEIKNERSGAGKVRFRVMYTDKGIYKGLLNESIAAVDRYLAKQK